MLKKCTLCAKEWMTVGAFLEDPLIEYYGYQATLDDPLKGFFLFSHLADGCRTTLALKVDVFAYMLPDAVGLIPMKSDPGCQGLCLDVKNDHPCEVANCVGNRVRQLIGQVKNYPKIA